MKVNKAGSIVLQLVVPHQSAEGALALKDAPGLLLSAKVEPVRRKGA
jgi:hypothetical protein